MSLKEDVLEASSFLVAAHARIAVGSAIRGFFFETENRFKMTIEEAVFQKIRINLRKLEAYGFEKQKDHWSYKTDFCEDAFTAVFTVDTGMHLKVQVIEKETGEEYVPLHVHSAQGAFVNHVREEYADLLKQVAIRIGDPVPFASDQANRIALAVTEKYGDTPDFLWDTEPNASNGVFRQPGSKKWYALILYTNSSNLKTMEQKEQEQKEKKLLAEYRRKRAEAKLHGEKLPALNKEKKKVQEEHRINILNLRIPLEQREILWKEKGIYPSFHMNAKLWISLPLDDTVSDERIMELVEQSYACTDRKQVSHVRPDGRRVWIVPANPHYYDLITVFDASPDTIWKQERGIHTGDIIYMYVAQPYSAILYRCTVTKAYSGSDETSVLMDIHVDEKYDRHLCTLAKMKQFHVTTVRGPRYMPEELEEYIRNHV